MQKLIVCTLLLTASVAAQQYVISTFAGGGRPVPAPTPAIDVSIGAPVSVATDKKGNVYFASIDLNVVFKLDRTGVLTRVAGTSGVGYTGDGGPATDAELRLNFGNASAVWAGLAVDNAGNLFIADTTNHCIRRVSTDGIITTVAGTGVAGFSGDGGPAIDAQLAYPWGVAVDAAGNLFILDTFNYRIRKVATSGIITTLAPVYGWALAVDSDGNVFVTAPGSAITKISADGIAATVPGVGGWGLAVDSHGNLFVADGVRTIQKISPDGTTTSVAGGGSGGLGDGGPAISAQLAYPSGVAVDAEGNLFIADRLQSRIRMVSPGAIITTVAGGGKNALADGGPATNALPWSVVSDNAGNVFIADWLHNRIFRVSASGVITTVAGNSTQGFSGDGGLAINAQLNGPMGLALDRAGNLFFIDLGNARVRKVSTSGVITTVAGNGYSRDECSRPIAGCDPGLPLGDGGPATSATLSHFTGCNFICGGLAIDESGNLFIADSVSGRIRKVSPDGIISTVAGPGIYGFLGDGGPATEANISYPAGVAVDRSGNLFIVDPGNGRIRRVSPGGTISTVAGGGAKLGTSADGGPATSAALSTPFGVALDGVGNLFIAEPFGLFDDLCCGRIRKISPDGIITTVAGNGAQGFSGDGGPANVAALNGPVSLTVDGGGDVYVADAGNNAVRVLRPTNYTALIGSVVDAASQKADPVSPGKIVIVYGAGLGPAQLTRDQNAGAKVFFNGIAAQVLYTSATQVTAVVPYEVSGTTAQVTLTYQGQSSNTFNVMVAQAAPSLFTVNQAGWGQAAATNAADGALNGPTHPVKIGDYISLYATGEGQIDSAAKPVLPVSVTIGGIPASLNYAGRGGDRTPGLFQVNVQVPAGVQPGGYVPVVLTVGDRSSGPAVWIAVADN